MKKIVSVAVAFAALTVCALAQTPQFPPPQQPPPQPQLPAPAVRTQVPLRPVPLRSIVPVAQFSTGDLRCAANLQSANILINALLTIEPDPVRPGSVQVEVLVDGVSLGTETVSVQNGAARVGRRATLAGAEGQHSVVYVVNDLARSAEQAFAHSCVSQTQTREPAPGHLTLPNLAFGDMLYAQLNPAPERRPFRCPLRFDTCVTLSEGAYEQARSFIAFSQPLIVRDIQTLTGVIQFPYDSICPRPQDAYITAQFAIAVRVSRVANPLPYVSVSWPGVSRQSSFVDTLDQPRYATGAAVGAAGVVGTPLPQGYQWIVMRAILACTRDGVLEVRLDPENSLRESNEGDNVLRLRYSTVP